MGGGGRDGATTTCAHLRANLIHTHIHTHIHTMSPCAQVCVLEYDAPSQTVTTCAHGDVTHTSVHT